MNLQKAPHPSKGREVVSPTSPAPSLSKPRTTSESLCCLTPAAMPREASVLVLASTEAWDPQSSLAHPRPLGLSPPPAWGPDVPPETQSSQAQGRLPAKQNIINSQRLQKLNTNRIPGRVGEETAASEPLRGVPPTPAGDGGESRPNPFPRTPAHVWP